MPDHAQKSRIQKTAPVTSGKRKGLAQGAPGPGTAQLAALSARLQEGPVVAAQRQLANGLNTRHAGLPAQLKAGVEALSGIDRDEEREHSNSAQPAQLDALTEEETESGN